MAQNKKKDTPAGYDRWDTFTGSTRGTGAPLTPTQKAAIEDILKTQAAMKKNAAKKGSSKAGTGKKSTGKK